MNLERSRVVVKNIYYMMAYAFGALETGDYERLGCEEFEHIENLMAAILTLGIDMQRRRGFERGYLPIEEELSSVRGRIDIPKTLRLKSACRTQVHCSYDELSEKTYKNRILATAARMLLNQGEVDPERRTALKRSLLALHDVEPLRPNGIEWGRLRYHRNNDGYRMLMLTCRMVIERALPSPEQDSVLVREFSSTRKLHDLYEKFVLEYFRVHHAELKPLARKIDLKMESATPDILPELKTDVTLEGNSTTLIIDTKCYGHILAAHFDKEIANANHLHQLSDYVFTEGYGSSGREVSGMLLYALTAQDQARCDAWRRAGHNFYLQTLDLGQEFNGIRKQLETIAALLE